MFDILFFDVSQIMVIVDLLNHYIWKYILLIMLVGAGFYFTISLKGIQFFRFNHMIKLVSNSQYQTNQISAFQALCTGLGARLGSGNIAGVAVALSLGGPGAIFWMWFIALIGMATSFIESVLAQLYKVKRVSNYDNDDFIYIGGPAFYIENGLGSRFFGILFSISLIMCLGLSFNTLQTNTISMSLENAFGMNSKIIIISITLATAAIVTGGIKRVAQFSEYVIPFMAITYILVGLWVIIINFNDIPSVFALIFKCAFGLQSGAGALAGYTISIALENGIKRGLFSNEAGMGSGANAAATASPRPNHPATQGYIQSFGVFLDTIVICTVTAMIILLSGVYNDIILWEELEGIALVQESLGINVGDKALGYYLVSLIITFFAFTSIISNYSYAEINILYIKNSKFSVYVLRGLVIASVLLANSFEFKEIWQIADLSMGIMAIINIVAIVLLSKLAIRVIKDYNDQLESGKDVDKITLNIADKNKFDAWKE